MSGWMLQYTSTSPARFISTDLAVPALYRPRSKRAVGDSASPGTRMAAAATRARMTALRGDFMCMGLLGRGAGATQNRMDRGPYDSVPPRSVEGVPALSGPAKPAHSLLRASRRAVWI